MSKVKFVHELQKSIEHYARANGVGPAPTWKIHKSTALSNLPDILGVYWHTTYFIECRVRERPKRKFDLMFGLTPLQRTTLRAITIAGGYAFLAVRLGKNNALIVNFKRLWRDKIFPTSIQVTFLGDVGMILDCKYELNLITRKPLGLWENIGRVIHDE